MPELEPCKLCGAALMKLRRVRGDGRVPVDAHPQAHGYIIITEPLRDDDDHAALELTEEEAAVCRTLGRPLHTDHWTTCPEAKEIHGSK